MYEHSSSQGISQNQTKTPLLTKERKTEGKKQLTKQKTTNQAKRFK